MAFPVRVFIHISILCLLILFYVWGGGGCCMYASASCGCLVPAEARRERYALLELQLEMVVSFMWVLGVKLPSSGRAAAAFDVSRGLLGGTELQFAFLTSCWG